MKRLFAILIVCAAVLLTACSNSVIEEEKKPEKKSMFVQVEDGNGYIVVYHCETRVMYTISTGVYNLGNFTVMLDADGWPQLWWGDEE